MYVRIVARRLLRPHVCFRARKFFCSDTEPFVSSAASKSSIKRDENKSDLISHRRTYVRQQDANISEMEDPLWTKVTTTEFQTFSDVENILSLAQNYDEVLRFVEEHQKEMRHKLVKLTFKKLCETCRHPKDAALIIQSPQFEILCGQAMKIMRTFEGGELIAILHPLVHLRVPPDTVIFQSCVRMLRIVINDLRIRSLMRLDQLLNFQIGPDHPANNDATIISMRVALPLVVDIKLQNNEFDPDVLPDVISSMRIITYNRLSESVINKLLLVFKDRVEQMNTFQAAKLLRCLISTELDRRKKIDKQLVDELTDLTLTRFLRTVDKNDSTEQDVIIDLFRNFVDQKIYSKELYELTARVQTDRNPTTATLLWTAKQLITRKHVSFPLNQRIAGNLSEQCLRQDFTVDMALSALPPLVESSDFEPKCGWDVIIDHLHDDEMMRELAVRSPFQYFKILESMALVAKFRESFYGEMSSSLSKISEKPVPLGTVGQRFLNVNVALKHENHFMCTEVVDKCLKSLEAFVQQSIQTLNPIRKKRSLQATGDVKDSLIKALGGTDFVRSGVWSQDGQFHDMLIFMRKGDYPIAIGKEILELDFVEEIKLPDECKK